VNPIQGKFFSNGPVRAKLFNELILEKTLMNKRRPHASQLPEFIVPVLLRSSPFMSASAPYSASLWKDIHACGDAVETSSNAAESRSRWRRTHVRSRGAHGANGRPPRSDRRNSLTPASSRHALIRTAFPGSVILETSGKHYPGEPLPRWALLVQRLASGEPLWRNLSLLAADTTPGSHTLSHAKKFLDALGQSLGIDRESRLANRGSCRAGYADRLRFSARSSDPRVDHRRTGRPSSEPSPCHVSGDSPAVSVFPSVSSRKKISGARSRPRFTRHAHRFIPPLLLVSYVELIAKIEASLVATKISGVVLAGYVPPPDAALPTVGLASDPGVLEINLAPCGTWADYDLQLVQLYAAAKSIGLCARKLQHNGREVGTGGGAHLVFGAPPGLYSPFFAFPALLPSVIRYFQRHRRSATLSRRLHGPEFAGAAHRRVHLRSSLRTGDRVCRRRDARLPANLALYDLLFRDLLMDRSGTLTAPRLASTNFGIRFRRTGRLGLVEFRAFENPPAMCGPIAHRAVRPRDHRAAVRRPAFGAVHSLER